MSDYPLGVHYFETNCQSDTHTHTPPHNTCTFSQERSQRSCSFTLLIFYSLRF